MKILQIDILTYGGLEQVRLNLKGDPDISVWTGQADRLEQVLSFIAFAFYGYSDEGLVSHYLPRVGKSVQAKATGGSISFLHNGEEYLLERLTTAAGESDKIKLLNETNGADLSADCSAQPGQDLFSLSRDEFVFALSLAPVPPPEHFTSRSEQIELILREKLAALHEPNSAQSQAARLSEQSEQLKQLIGIAKNSDKNQAELIDKIYQHKQGIKQREEQLLEIIPRVHQLELLEDKARYENLLLLRSELAAAESEAYSLTREAQEKNLPSAIELTAYEDFYVDWNQKAKNLNATRMQLITVSEEVKECYQRGNELKNQLDQAEERESNLLGQLAGEQNNFERIRNDYAGSGKSHAGNLRLLLLLGLAAVAGLILVLADSMIGGSILLGGAFVATLLVVLFAARRKTAGAAALDKARSKVDRVQSRLSEHKREKNSLLWRLDEEITAYQKARAAEDRLLAEVSRGETATNHAGYELVTSLSRYVRIQYPEEAARALRELRERVTDSAPVDARVSQILGQIAALKAGRTDEEIEREYEYATEQLFGSALTGQDTKGLPSVATSRYNPDALANAKAVKLRLELEIDQSRKKYQELSAELVSSFSALNLADLYRQKQQLDLDRAEIKEQAIAIEIALEYLEEAEPYRVNFYRQLTEMSNLFSAQILDAKEPLLDRRLTGALALRFCTTGAEKMPLFVPAAVSNGELCALPERVQTVCDGSLQLIILQQKGQDLPGKWELTVRPHTV